MFNISSYLQKFKNVAKGHIFEKDSILEVFSNIAGVKLQKKDIQIKDSTLYINTNPVIKNEIFMKKRALLEALGNRKGAQKIVDLR